MNHPTLRVSPWFTDIDRKTFMNMCGFFTSLQMRSLLVPTMIKLVDVKRTNMVIYHELHTIHCQECGFEEGKLPTVPTRNRDLTTKTSPPKLWFQSDESKGFFSHNWYSLNTAVEQYNLLNPLPPGGSKLGMAATHRVWSFVIDIQA